MFLSVVCKSPDLEEDDEIEQDEEDFALKQDQEWLVNPELVGRSLQSGMHDCAVQLTNMCCLLN